MIPTPSLRASLAPRGQLRAAINLGNPILARADGAGQLSGISVDLAAAFAHALGVELALVAVDTAAKSVELLASDAADIGFFAIDPVRGADIAFSPPYLVIEGAYLVRADSPIRANEEVDRGANRVVVGAGSAYDLYLTRSLAHARIVRAPGSPAVVDTFLEQDADVAAGVKQQLASDALRIGGLRLLEGHFMLIEQAMGTPRRRGAEAAACLSCFIEGMKAEGFVAAALARHTVQGARLAPAASAE